MKEIVSILVMAMFWANLGLAQGNRAKNEDCLKCHGKAVYAYQNMVTGKNVKALMDKAKVIDTAHFYKGVHKSFVCADCHSPEYDSFPHPNQLRFEPINTCIDCHGGDETYAKYHFESIDSAFMKSVHSNEKFENFTCWSCHNPHSYSLSARSETALSNVVVANNAVCLECHSNTNSAFFQLISDKNKKPLTESHDWLPNQELHFGKVRCIECHNKPDDSLLVAHLVMPAKDAVKNCKECHSQNSILLSSWYKFENIQNRDKQGFVNGVLLNQAYVIGASRNQFLNIASAIIFALTLIGIFVHALLRLKSKRKA